MIKKIKNISISYKINIPLIFIILFGLGIIAVNSYVSIHDIEQNALNDIRQKSQSKELSVADKEYIKKYVSEVKKIFQKQLWILVIVNIVIIILLLSLLNIVVKKPVFKLLKSLKKITSEIESGKAPPEVYKQNKLFYGCEDEMGKINLTINSLLESMNSTFLELQKSQKHNSEYINAIYQGGLVSISDKDGNITYVNDKLCEVSGYSRDELIGSSHNIFRDITTPNSVYKELWDTVQSGKIFHRLMKNRAKNGEAFYANTTIIPIKNEKDEVVEYIVFRDDVTELINSKKELKRTYLHDSLTNLGNRFKLLNDITQNSYLAIIDIHLFKEINDFYGYKIGDIVLKDLGKKLFEYFHKRGMNVYHLNSDEFAVLADKIFISKNEFYEYIKEFLAQNIRNALNIDDNVQINTRLTCGVAYDNENLINHADIAHKQAKKLNRDIVEYCDEINTDEEYRINLQWTNELKDAIAENRIETYFQPIVDSKTGKIEKHETLMRLIKRDGTVVSPAVFLDIAKKTRIYQELTKIVAIKAFNKFSECENDCEFSINLSIEDIVVYNVSSWIFDLAVQKGVNKRLVIEIVESEGIESFEEVQAFIAEAKSYGMKIAIDDFGTGYSNFEYLIKLNADYLKIDGSLMKEIDKDEKLYGVVETIVSFAKKNSIKVIGEFVSTAEIYEKTKQLGIEYSQGYFLGHPSCEVDYEKKEDS